MVMAFVYMSRSVQ